MRAVHNLLYLGGRTLPYSLDEREREIFYRYICSFWDRYSTDDTVLYYLRRSALQYVLYRRYREAKQEFLKTIASIQKVGACRVRLGTVRTVHYTVDATSASTYYTPVSLETIAIFDM